MRSCARAFLTLILAGLPAVAAAHQPPPTALPDTPRQRVTDEYHGTLVADDYRWLEDASDPAVERWSDAQNALARAWLDGRKSRAGLREEVKRLYSYEAPSWWVEVSAGGRLFAVKRQPPREQSFIVSIDASADPGSERVVFDPNQLDPSGKTAFDWFVPSRDGRYLGISI